MLRLIVLLWTLLLATSALSQDASATDQLLQALAGMDRVGGRFEQQLYDQDGQLMSESSGHFRLLRPGYFSWEIESPDSQLIVAGPEYIWHLDRDLETATRRPVNDSAQMSPLQVLGGNESALRNGYQVSTDDPDRYRLVPLSQDAGFVQLVLQLEGGELSALEIKDNLNQRVEVSFEGVKDMPDLAPLDFLFVPPEGTDLFYYDE
tara:strand:+ start:24928 stop:25545 length:618 start_codon:yes stop_codon:yes gene_type:complete